MGNWYIIRNNLQYGPYTVEQMLSMEADGQLFVGDTFFDAFTQRNLTMAVAQKEWRKKPKGIKRKKTHKGLISLAVIILLIVGGILYYNLTKTSSNMVLGGRQAGVNAKIPSAGGIVTVSDPKSPVNGMTITVASGSYDSTKNFAVSTRPIKSHSFGPLFTPITPLITVENGHQFSNEPMVVNIPISKADDEFAMGFYYDEKTGKLEGIPTIELDNNHITLLMNHFSEPVIAKAKKSDLDGINIDTGFTPKVDNWQFVNIGSWLAQGGFCSGQSESAMWYFSEKYKKNNEPRLYGRFDNNNYGLKTKSFWMDDSWGIRLASMVQEEPYNKSFTEYSETFTKYSATLAMYSFKYAMFLTKEPQFVGVYGTYVDKAGKTQSAGHAIIAYKIEDNKIYVSDPNYPNDVDRYINSNETGFLPYSSGANATVIADLGEVNYSTISYRAKSALVDYGKISQFYEQMRKGTVGNDKFPTFTIKYAKKIDNATNIVTQWADCPDQLKLSTADTAKVDADFSGKIVFGVFCKNSDQISKVYKGLDDCKGISNISPPFDGIIIYTVDLDDGVNDLAFFNGTDVSKPNDTKYSVTYCDFKRIKVIYNEKIELKFSEGSYKAFLQKPIKFTVKESASPADVKYVWNFGNGEEQVETVDPEAEYTYKNVGENTLTCTMVSKKDNKVLATARVPIAILDLYGKWDFNFTIKEAGPVDFILNSILKFFIGIINSAIPEAAIPPDTKVTIKGTVIGGELTVIPPDPTDKSKKIKVSLQELTSSTDFVDPAEQPLLGEMTISKDGKIVIEFKGDYANNSNGSLKFEGRLFNGAMSGKFDAPFVMSGEFGSSKK